MKQFVFSAFFSASRLSFRKTTVFPKGTQKAELENGLRSLLTRSATNELDIPDNLVLAPGGLLRLGGFILGGDLVLSTNYINEFNDDLYEMVWDYDLDLRSNEKWCDFYIRATVPSTTSASNIQLLIAELTAKIESHENKMPFRVWIELFNKNIYSKLEPEQHIVKYEPLLLEKKEELSAILEQIKTVKSELFMFTAISELKNEILRIDVEIEAYRYTSNIIQWTMEMSENQQLEDGMQNMINKEIAKVTDKKESSRLCNLLSHNMYHMLSETIHFEWSSTELSFYLRTVQDIEKALAYDFELYLVQTVVDRDTFNQEVNRLLEEMQQVKNVRWMLTEANNDHLRFLNKQSTLKVEMKAKIVELQQLLPNVQQQLDNLELKKGIIEDTIKRWGSAKTESERLMNAAYINKKKISEELMKMSASYFRLSMDEPNPLFFSEVYNYLFTNRIVLVRGGKRIHVLKGSGERVKRFVEAIETKVREGKYTGPRTASWVDAMRT